MKTIILTSLIIFSTLLWNKGYSLNLDAHINLLSEPGDTQYNRDGSSPFQDGAGGGFGISSDFRKIGLGVVQFRGDVHYHSYKYQITRSETKTYNRVPIFLGARFLFTSIPILKPFVETGIEITSDELTGQYSNYAQYIGLNETNKREMSFGASFGGGTYIDFDGFTLGFHLRYHAVTHSYFSYGPSIGFYYK